VYGLKEETAAISALTGPGFSLDGVLNGLSLPAGAGLTSSLGISGLSSLTSSKLWNEDGAVGVGEGDDWEDEVDREMHEEEEEEEEEEERDFVKREDFSPPPNLGPGRRVRVVKRLIERPKTVYERFPGFEKDKVLNFTELFKGQVTKKPRVVKRPLLGTQCCIRFEFWDRH
jgi:transcription initiation factor TFIID subunit 1, fungi type